MQAPSTSSSDTRPTSRPLASLMTILPGLLRFAKLAPNFSPIGGMALFAGARLRGWQAFALPIAVMIVTDIGLNRLYGYEPFNPFVYASFLIYVLLGRLVYRTGSVWKLGAASVLGSIQFFVITNFGHWLTTNMYPHTFEGLAACFLAALPFYGFDHPWLFGFFGNTLVSDLFFTGLLFSAHELLARRWSPRESLDSIK